MANTLTALVPSIILQIQDVLRTTGAILNLGMVDAQSSAAAVGQAVTLPENFALAAYDITPGNVPPALVDIVAAARSMQIEKARGVRFHLTGEDEVRLGELGANFKSIGIQEAIATIIHDMADYHAAKLSAGSGEAIGTVGTDPFANSPNILMDVWESLVGDSSSPVDRMGIYAPRHYSSAGKLGQFQKLSEAPIGTNFATGEIGTLGGFTTGYDQALIAQHTAGAGSGYVTDGVQALGSKTVVVKTGTGALKAGDVLTFAADAATKYVLAEDYAGGAGTITLTRELKVEVANENAITKLASHRQSFLGNRRSTMIATRTPAQPSQGDAAREQTIIRDPVSGLAMRLAYYPGYHAGQWELSMVWGSAVRRPELLRKLIS